MSTLEALEARTFNALGKLAVATAAGDKGAMDTARQRLWNAGDDLCHDRHGEPLSVTLRLPYDVMESSVALAHTLNYFALWGGFTMRAKMPGGQR